MTTRMMTMAKKKIDFKQLVRDKLKLKTTVKPTEINTMVKIDNKGIITIAMGDGRVRVLAKTDIPFERIQNLLKKPEDK